MALPPFDHAVAVHGPAVLRVCRSLLGAHDAEDACSETFLAALATYPQLPEDSNVRGWLITIAYNKAMDSLRATARAPVPTDDVAERVAPEGQPVEPDGTLWAAVRALPPKQRGAVVYHHLADLPYSEVAALLGTSVAAARRSAADGIAALRSTYRQEDQQ
ncbi:MAG: sigma-70 family RNA polymerase sigma factor [Actinobacteria bacterium]|nr:sigma-70 family RNA polymerase sigma factor [Actinomycetota bacterium]